MTRRPAVNLPIEDDSTYLTVVHPYPPNANLRLPTDRRTLALWLACCTGKPDVLIAMFHKPKAAGMVIIEVDREFDRFDNLLGMHSWSEFLLAPTEEEAGNSSKVFYCTYHNANAVRGAGWNRVEIQDHWFHEWRLNNDRIKHPYPKTTYCDVPPESHTGLPTCHRLPRRLFPVTASGPELPAPRVKELKEGNAPKHSTTAVDMLAIFGTAPKASSNEGSATGTQRDATAGASTSGAIPAGDQSRADSEAAVKDNPWDGYNTPRPDLPTKVQKRGGVEWICPDHGSQCTPGICIARARLDRDERWQKEREERAENKRKWMERRAKKSPRGSMSEGSVDESYDQGSLRFRTKSPDSEEECTQSVISADGEEFPMSADMGQEHPIVSSSTQAGGIDATRLGDRDGDDDDEVDVVETETGIQEMRIRERNKDEGEGEMGISLNGHRRDLGKNGSV